MTFCDVVRDKELLWIDPQVLTKAQGFSVEKIGDFKELIPHIRALLLQKSAVLVAIDGYGGAGKTTLAKEIQKEFADSKIITLDVFATDTKHGADRARFIEQVLEPLSNGRAARYQPFSWRSRTLGDWVDVSAAGLIVLEGVSVLGEDFIQYYDLRIWIDCSLEVAGERVKERERKAGREFSLDNWFNVWIAEDREYGLTEPWKRADVVLGTGDGEF